MYDDGILAEWWRQTSGPRRFMHILTDNALSGRCCAVDLNADSDFFDVFRDNVLGEDSAVSIEYENVAEDVADEDFLHNLLERWVAPDYEIDLLSESPFEDMAAKRALENRIVFVALSGRCPWAKKAGAAFNRGAKKSVGYCGALVFVTDFLDEDFPSGCGVDRLRLTDFVSPYDYRYFASHLLAERGVMDNAKRLYMSGLAEKITAPFEDFKLTAKIAVPQLYRDPTGTAERILGEDFSEEQCNKSLWEMQIQTVLPISENIRQTLIKNYGDELANILHTPVEDDFGNILNEPLDMELRHLRFYGAAEKFFRTTDWETLNFVCDIRNRLAHLKCLAPEEMERVFALG